MNTGLVWKDRLVKVIGDDDEAKMWAMSKAGDHDDFDYCPPLNKWTSDTAVAGSFDTNVIGFVIDDDGALIVFTIGAAYRFTSDRFKRKDCRIEDMADAK